MSDTQPCNNAGSPTDNPASSNQAQQPASNDGTGKQDGPAMNMNLGESQTVAALRKELEQLRSERDDLNNRLLLTVADYQNYVRRTRNEVAEARQQQLFETAGKLVEVLDQFDRALEVDPAKVSGENLLKGVGMVKLQFLQILERMGIQRIDARPGQEFDPHLHEALMRQPATDGVPTNHVTMQLQPGYVMGQRTVRPVKVAVAQ